MSSQDQSNEPVNARERSRLETRRRLMEQATQLFAAQGVATTRAADIARAAGVAVGTLYLHFGDKQGLLRAVLYEGLEEMLEELQRLADHPPEDTAEAVRTHSEIMVRFAEERPGLCRILFDPEAVRTKVSTEINDYLVSLHEKRLREGIEAGISPASIDPLLASHAVVGMFVQVLDWWARHPGEARRETLVDTLTHLRLHGLYQIR